MGDHYVGKPSATGQPTRPTQPFVLPGSIPDVCSVAPPGECLRGYKPRAADCSRLAPRVAASCLAKHSCCYQLLRAGITRCAVLRGSLCLCTVVERCDLTVIKRKIYLFILRGKT